MRVGMIGLGRMGLGMSVRLVAKGHAVVGSDLDPRKAEVASENGIEWVRSPRELIAALPRPCVVMISVPAGNAIAGVVASLEPLLTAGDIVADMGNSFYGDSQARAAGLAKRDVGFLDVGVSGGVWGADVGYCLMAGGRPEDYRVAEPAFKDIAQDGGCALVGASGMGHFAKMVHNGIEYGLMQAYAEGLEVLKEAGGFDLAAVADLWNRGSVIRSWLLELGALALHESTNLADIRGWVADTGEGAWAVEEAMAMSVPTPVMALSLMMRYRSRQEDSFAAKFVAALRKQFGGHAVKPFDDAQPFDGAQDVPFDGAQPFGGAQDVPFDGAQDGTK